MSKGVKRFGGDPDEDGDEMAAFNEKNGSASDLAVVDSLGHDTVRAALALWTTGANYGDIAKQFQFRTPALARMVIERALADSVDDTQDRAKMRRRMSLTLDRLLRSVMPKAVNAENPEQLAAVRTSLTILERFARLNGLDAPIEHKVSMPENEKFLNFVEMAARGMGLALPEEADIWDAEYVEEANGEGEEEERGDE